MLLNAQRSQRLASLAILFVGVASMGSSCKWSAAPPPNPQATGRLVVNDGFGAKSNPPYQCTGDVNITATPASVTGTVGINRPLTFGITYSGFSSTSPDQSPACQRVATFEGLAAGTWRVTKDTAPGLSCSVPIQAGNTTILSVWYGLCDGIN
jgi:hypothetical protein